ncbi:ATP-dependent helicase [Inediibacterium massiliense]|uniref:ATP-dependent helicase n=1 Tax=Inediibacterium massiliense TaxID=1658111 RepID=UPI0006B40A82|nr:ATP-dependent helicase [Inediibacterium massiliense]
MYNSFFQMLQKNHNIQLNTQQKKAVLHKNGPALILAVPGSGKTTTLICRTAHLIFHHKIHPSHILSVTFSKASAKDMKKRFYDVFGNHIHSKVYFSTIHQLSLKIVNQYARKNNISYTIMEGNHSPIQKTILLKNIYEQFNHEKLTEEKLEALLSHISFVKNNMIDENDFSSYDFEINHFLEIYISYEKYKKKHGFIDFDDMLSLAFSILKKDKMLLHQYRNHYSYIQVDEAQDTSKIQHNIIYLLSSPHHNLFMVGDDDQSIYGFRGAHPKALLSFDEIYKGGKLFFLEKNYRSSEEVVCVSNDFIKKNTQRYEKNMYTQNQSYEPVQIIKTQDFFEQIQYIYKELKKPYEGTTAILYRSHVSSMALVDFLLKNNISFSIHGFQTSFFHHWLIKDLLSFFKVALNPYDLESFEKIYYKMNGYISKKSILSIKEYQRPISVFDNLLSEPDLKSFQIKNLKRLQKDFHTISSMKPYDALVFIEENLDYKKYLKNYCQRIRSSFDNTLLVLEQLKLISKNASSLIELIERLNELESFFIQNSKNKEKVSIYLSTVHGSKGLEFDRVYMIDLTDGQFPPKIPSDLSKEETITLIEEERRLFYVGMTRAKKNLSLMIPTFLDGSYQKSSPFVEELQSHLKTYSSSPKDFSSSHPIKSEKTIDHSFSIHMKIHHKFFGEGKILSIDQDTFQIDFKKFGVRCLSIGVCIEQGMIQ